MLLRRIAAEANPASLPLAVMSLTHLRQCRDLKQQLLPMPFLWLRQQQRQLRSARAVVQFSAIMEHMQALLLESAGWRAGQGPISATLAAARSGEDLSQQSMALQARPHSSSVEIWDMNHVLRLSLLLSMASAAELTAFRSIARWRRHSVLSLLRYHLVVALEV